MFLNLNEGAVRHQARGVDEDKGGRETEVFEAYAGGGNASDSREADGAGQVSAYLRSITC